jgi:hypothetical protein
MTISSTPTRDYVGSLLQLFFRCSPCLVVTTIYDPFTCKFPGCNGRCSASIAYPSPYMYHLQNTAAFLHATSATSLRRCSAHRVPLDSVAALAHTCSGAGIGSFRMMPPSTPAPPPPLHFFFYLR